MAHTLLLADDSVTIQRVIELTFADEDVNVVAVSDGDQAIQRIDQSPPDIVLADVGMPGRNGYEVAQHVKHTPKLSHIPVVLLTGAFEPVDQARAAEARCDGVLAKPFEPQMVIARVKELLAKMPGNADVQDLHAQIERVPAPGVDIHHQIEQASVEDARQDAAPSIEDYFDKLDAAFASLNPPPKAVPAVPPPAPAPPPQLQKPAATAHHDEGPGGMPDIDWFGAAATVPRVPTVPEVPKVPEVPEVPTVLHVPEAHSEIGSEVSRTPEALHAPQAPQAPQALEAPQAPKMPLLEDAFAALLAAEQAEVPASAPRWPATLPSADELADQVARIVLERLSDRAVREAVAEIVSQTAERLVREEIDRIKAALK